MRPKTAIIDLDATAADSSHRQHFLTGEKGVKSIELWRQETDKDKPVEWCVALIKGLIEAGYDILYLTGREETCREETKDWLVHNMPTGRLVTLVMRPKGDNRPDYVVKEDLYLNKIAPFHMVTLAVDDKPKIAEMWRKYGIVCLHCGPIKEDEAVNAKIHAVFEEEMENRKKEKIE